MLGACFYCSALLWHLMVCLSHAMHAFLTNISYMFGLFTSLQQDVVGMFMFNYVYVSCFSMYLLPTYGFGCYVFVQPEVVGSFCGIYRDRHFICFGDICSLPSHPYHSSCIRSCCAVLSRYLILSISDQAAVLVFLALYNHRL